DVSRSLDELHAHALTKLELAVGQVSLRLLEIGDSERDVLERALLARPLGREERQLSAPRVRADERERVLLVDHVHADVLRQQIDDRLAVGDPEGDVIQGLGPHAARVPTAYLSTACGSRPHAAAAACSSGTDQERSAAWPRCTVALSSGPSVAGSRNGGRRG